MCFCFQLSSSAIFLVHQCAQQNAFVYEFSAEADIIQLDGSLSVGGVNQLTAYIRSKLETTELYRGCLGVWPTFSFHGNWNTCVHKTMIGNFVMFPSSIISLNLKITNTGYCNQWKSSQLGNSDWRLIQVQVTRETNWWALVTDTRSFL